MASICWPFSERHIRSPVSVTLTGECNAITNRRCGESDLTWLISRAVFSGNPSTVASAITCALVCLASPSVSCAYSQALRLTTPCAYTPALRVPHELVPVNSATLKNGHSSLRASLGILTFVKPVVLPCFLAPILFPLRRRFICFVSTPGAAKLLVGEPDEEPFSTAALFDLPESFTVSHPGQLENSLNIVVLRGNRRPLAFVSTVGPHDRHPLRN